MIAITLTANGNTSVPQVNIADMFGVAISGTFGGASIAVQYPTSSNTFATYVSGETGTYTSAAERQFRHIGPVKGIQLAVSNASNTTSVTVCISKYKND